MLSCRCELSDPETKGIEPQVLLDSLDDSGHFGFGYSLRNQVSWATLSLPGRGVHAASSPQTPRARSPLDAAHNCLERQCTGRPRTVASIAGHTLRRDGVHIQSSRVCAQLGVRCQVARARHGRCVATHGYPRLFLRFLQRQSEEKRCLTLIHRSVVEDLSLYNTCKIPTIMR